MKEENRKYAQEAYDIVSYAAKKIGSRLPGSDGEKKYADYMGDKLKEIGIEPKQEEFAVSPRSGIGGLSYAGWAGFILSVAAYIALGVPSVWFGMAAFGIVTLIWLVASCFLYKTWFDMFFPQEISQNTYGELLPPTENMITQLFFPVIRTQAGAGVTASIFISIRISRLSVCLQPTARSVSVQSVCSL